METLVGCCGYPVSRSEYYGRFKAVEVNMTFYRYPRSSLVERWRREAPTDFEFTVKAHQDISHRFKLDINRECLDAFERVKEVCQILPHPKVEGHPHTDRCVV